MIPHPFHIWLPKLSHQNLPCFLCLTATKVSQSFEHFSTFLSIPPSMTICLPLWFHFLGGQIGAKMLMVFNNGSVSLTRTFYAFVFFFLPSLPSLLFPHLCTSHIASYSLSLIYLAWFCLSAFVPANPFTLNTLPSLLLHLCLPWNHLKCCCSQYKFN